MEIAGDDEDAVLFELVEQVVVEPVGVSKNGKSVYHGTRIVFGGSSDGGDMASYLIGERGDKPSDPR